MLLETVSGKGIFERSLMHGLSLTFRQQDFGTKSLVTLRICGTQSSFQSRNVCIPQQFF